VLKLASDAYHHDDSKKLESESTESVDERSRGSGESDSSPATSPTLDHSCRVHGPLKARAQRRPQRDDSLLSRTEQHTTRYGDDAQLLQRHSFHEQQPQSRSYTNFQPHSGAPSSLQLSQAQPQALFPPLWTHHDPFDPRYVNPRAGVASFPPQHQEVVSHPNYLQYPPSDQEVSRVGPRLSLPSHLYSEAQPFPAALIPPGVSQHCNSSHCGTCPAARNLNLVVQHQIERIRDNILLQRDLDQLRDVVALTSNTSSCSCQCQHFSH
jgi:hypothetical protein